MVYLERDYKADSQRMQYYILKTDKTSPLSFGEV